MLGQGREEGEGELGLAVNGTTDFTVLFRRGPVLRSLGEEG